MAETVLFSALVLAMLAVPGGSALAEAVRTPQEFCAEMPATAQADCRAAADLLTAPSGTQPSGGDLSVFLRADAGALSVEYRVSRDYPADDLSAECAAGDTIALPAGEAVRLLFTSVDAIYSFEVPDYVESVYLIPGRIEERLIETPADAGEAGGILHADADGSQTAVGLRFMAGAEPFDPQAICEG